MKLMTLYVGGTFGLLFLGLLLIMKPVEAISPTNPHDLEVGRFQLEGSYILDTITGRVEKIDVWQKAYPSGMFRSQSRTSLYPPYCPPPTKGEG